MEPLPLAAAFAFFLYAGWIGRGVWDRINAPRPPCFRLVDGKVCILSRHHQGVCKPPTSTEGGE